MKFTYEFIKENLRIYNEAKSKLPIISQYEKQEVSYNAMRTLKLEQFADFYNFISNERKNGFELIQAVSFKELKQILVDKTRSDRFKKLFSNMSQSKFTKLITEDSEKFDRYLNGRWITKPGYNSRGRRLYGKRSNDTVDGLNTAIVPLINWIISNEIETCESSSNTFESFSSQSAYSNRIKWYKGVLLDISKLPTREIEVTYSLLNSLVDFIGDSEIDFRKLNSDFIIETLSNKIKGLMYVPSGTTLVSLCDYKNNYGRQQLTVGNNYVVENSSINYGFLSVMVRDDSNSLTWHDYKLFEDVSLQRDMILSQLGII
jgi:hypothetical protein